MKVLTCWGVSVDYGPVRALDGIDLEVANGETVALLGPSGSGKTTLLHAIAGFLPLSSGEITIGDQTVSSPGKATAPENRSVAMVFQNYALWPHLTAIDTIAYPLRRGGAGNFDARRQAQELADKLGIGDIADRRPAQLSGGQQQRVGLARAIARQAQLYLFDEPTAHLDAAVRQAVASEMIHRQRETGAAAVYATHDAAEALAVADRIAILRDGRTIQVGTPQEVYEQPVDLWAARLTGPASALNIEGRSTLVRPDWVEFGGPIQGKVVSVWYRGSHTDYRLTTDFGNLEVRLLGPPRCSVGETQGWRINRSHTTALAVPDK